MIQKQAVPGLTAWNLENYTNLIHNKINREKEVKPNHLSSLLEEYGDLLSDKAKHYLNIDFSLDAESSEKNTKLDEIIKNRKFQRLCHFLKLFQNGLTTFQSGWPVKRAPASAAYNP